MRQSFPAICMVGALLLGAAFIHDAAAAERSLTTKGRALVTRMCASCHAIGKDDPSPHPAAPPFRHLDRQLDLDTLAERLRRGVFSGHHDMPMFRFSSDDAHAVVAYLRSIQGP